MRVAVGSLVLASALAACSRGTDAPPAKFVEEQSCASCHPEQHRLWQGSHHDLAMQAADERTVLGDFNDARFASHGLGTRFSRRDGKFIVTTDGPDARLSDYEVKYVFGVSPLQQYLLELPGGRLQALSVAWDTKRKRWFHLYPRERIDHRDELHWTKPSQNWNFMCAECHSTGLRKNYDPAKDSYDTRWFQIDVGCQACHGPGSMHVAWAKANPNARGLDAAAGFAVDLRATSNRVQIDACARCHSRRSVIAPDYVYGRPLMDTHLPVLLEEGVYYADGQILEEDYEYDSFLQSRMAQKGVRCSDCHDAHSGARKAEGNALCARCHNADKPDARAGIDVSGLKKEDYDSRAHHFHAPGKPGSACVDCHAPRTTYMVVDPRADHSFRIPRPDLTVAIGTLNACNGCHRDRTPQWAAAEISRRHPDYRPSPHYGEALAAGRRGAPGAVAALTKVVDDSGQPAIVRATAVALLARYPGALSARVIGDTIRDADPLVRQATVAGLDSMPREQRLYWLAPTLRDPVRAVRIEAARQLATVPDAAIGESNRAAFSAALAELEESHRANQDRPEGRIGLGNLYLARGRAAEAEAAYRSALAFDPVLVPALVNLADFYRAAGREAEAEELLRKALAAHPRNPALTRALALSLVRQKRKPEALKLLAGAASADADAAYLYALALDDAGRRGDALRVLERALPRANGNRDILLALASFEQQSGHPEKAVSYLKRLAAINPDDPALGGR